jgi:hypothetical protein
MKLLYFIEAFISLIVKTLTLCEFSGSHGGDI